MNKRVLPSTPNVSDQQNATEAVVLAVADAEGVSPLELQPLTTAADPDALDALFRDGRSDVAVEFTYHGYRVHVSGSGHVTVRDAAGR